MPSPVTNRITAVASSSSSSSPSPYLPDSGELDDGGGGGVGGRVGLKSDDPELDGDHNQRKHRGHKKTLAQVLKSKFFLSVVMVCAVAITLLCIGLVATYEKDNDVTATVDAWNDKLSAEQLLWFQSGLDELRHALGVSQNTRQAKHVILFVADGMGPSTVTAARIYKEREEGHLIWERFPHMGMLKTYCVDKQVPDSLCTATALFGGVKCNYETGGVDSSVKLSDCAASLNETTHVESILHWAQNEDMGTGFVTTTRVVHATPSALYANVPNRRWECEANMPAEASDCRDIGRQLVETAPGNRINVVMGGGRQCLVSGVVGTEEDPLDTWACARRDGRDLIKTWQELREQQGESFEVVSNSGQLASVSPDTEFVMGIFANGHLKYDSERDASPAGMPSLADMTVKAIEVLQKHRNGFVLVVEAGMIDQAHHRGMAKQALHEVLALDRAINETLRVMAAHLDETLIVVTSDHAHTLTISGYADRGNSIFGVAQKSKMDSIPYTTLNYATGGPDGFQYVVDDATGTVKRRDPSQDDTESFSYVQQVGILTDENTHSGSDVAIHALGPFAHLFHRTHEQSYVAHVISYAARIGRFRRGGLL